MKRILFLVTLLCVTCGIANAQTTRLLRGGYDISSNMINSMFQDKEGIVWICTENGINRLDGAKATTIYSEQDNNSNFSSIFQDSKGRYFACASEHVMLYDERYNSLIPIHAIQDDGKEVNFRAYDVIELSDGTILTYTSGYGVFKLEQDGNTLVFKRDKKIIPYLYISRMLQDSRGRVWASTERGLVCWDGKRLYTVKNVEQNLNRTISSIVESQDGTIWCASHVDGLWMVDTRTYSMSIVPKTKGMPVTAVLANRKGQLLFGTNGMGAFSVDVSTLDVRSFSFPFGSVPSDKLNVHALLDDNQGNLWIGCYQKGVVVVPRRENRINYLGHYALRNDVIGNCCIMALAKDEKNVLWVGADGDGLYAVTGRGSYEQNASSVHYSPSATMPKTIMALYPDGKGKMWIGSWLQGLYVMDLATRKCTKVDLPLSNPLSCSVFSFSEDGFGHLWIATMGEGLYCMDLTSNKISAVRVAKEGVGNDAKANVIPNKWINKVCMGADGIMYIATADGVGAIDVNTHNCLRAFHGKNSILSGVNVMTLCQTKDGRLWIGSNKGLMSYNPETEEIVEYNQSNGLGGNSVLSIIDAGKGKLWISTNLGISSLNLKDGKISNYSSGNGMHGNEFTKNAAFLAKDGTVYFGGTEGVSFFRPELLMSMNDKPVVKFANMYLNGIAVNAGTLSDGDQIVDTDIMHAKEICVAANDNSFSIELTSMNFLNSVSVEYEYSLDGDTWVKLPHGSNMISFSSLKPGKHTLAVRAEEWGMYSEIKEITIIVRHPWYNTWWAWLLYLIIIGGAAYAAQRYYKERRQSAIDLYQLKQQEEITEAKLSFFISISHEIRTPMTLIVSPLQRLLNTDTDPKRQSAYHLMNRNAQRILQLINQLLDVRKIDKGQMKLYFREVDIVDYVHNLVLGFQELCDTKKISISFESQVEQIKAWIDPLNFDKIVVNLLSNAFKYTPKGGEVKVKVSLTDDNKYTISVQDSGKGMTEDEIQHVFDRFFQQHCAENSAVQGSGVGLNLSKSLAQMHHGDIIAANNEDGVGSNFVVVMPLGNSHLSEDELEKVPEREEAVPAASMPTPSDAAPLKPLEDEKRHMGPRRHLLVVEDDEEIQAYLKAEFSAYFTVTCCNNGEEALAIIRKRLPDLVITDVMMPVMDGITLLTNIRQNTTMNNIPVILLTAKSSEQDNIVGLEKGADAFVTKPFNIEILRRTALNLVNRQQQLKNIYDGRQTPVVDKVKVQSPDERLMERIMKVINANISNPDLGNELITKEVGISRVHLYRKLKEMTNLSLRDFIKNIRLNEAARLLSENHHSIAEIAMRTGFDNVSYFTVVFKQKYGIPPSAYMNQSYQKKVAEEIEAEKAEK